MEFKKGSNRIVFMFPKLGFVIKFPRFFIWLAIKGLSERLFSWDFHLVKKFFIYPVRVMGGFQSLILKGWSSNWGEYIFYSETGHILLQPTYFSLFGFINIQKYGKSQKLPGVPLIKHFIKITDNEVSEDGHHFFNWENFCFSEGKIKMIDYGSECTQAIILLYGGKISKEFDLTKVIEN